MYEHGINSLGLPLHLTMHPDNDGYFEARAVVDHAVAAKDRLLAETKNPEPGTRIVVEYIRPEGLPLPPVGL